MTMKWNDLARNYLTMKQSERIPPLLTNGSRFITLVRTMHPFFEKIIKPGPFWPFHSPRYIR